MIAGKWAQSGIPGDPEVARLGEPEARGLPQLRELRQRVESLVLRATEWRMINTFAPWAAWLSPRLAAVLHRWEVRHVRRHGSVIVVAFDHQG